MTKLNLFKYELSKDYPQKLIIHKTVFFWGLISSICLIGFMTIMWIAMEGHI